MKFARGQAGVQGQVRTQASGTEIDPKSVPKSDYKVTAKGVAEDLRQG